MEIFKKESLINKIGGRILDDYLHFRKSVLYVNANLIPLFFMLGFDDPKDKDLIIDLLLQNESIATKIKRAYSMRVTERIMMGELKIECILSSKILGKVFDTQSEREKYLKCQLNRVLTLQFNDLYNTYTNKYKPTFQGYSKLPFQICRESLLLSPLGFEIDVDKFITIYRSFIEADESFTRKQHQEAADAINRFFNGSMAITQKELSRYFVIDCGIVKPNPKSITIDNYTRLGCRTQRH